MNTNENVVNSREISNRIGIQHKTIMRNIRNIIDKLGCTQDCSYLFIDSNYVDAQNRTKPMYLLTVQGLKTYIDHSRKTKNIQKLIDLYNEMSNGNESYILSDRSEHIFKQVLLGFFEEDMIKEQYSVLNYRIDYYIPNVSLIIEYDESHHDSYREKDEKRMLEILEALRMELVNDTNTDAYDVEKIYSKNKAENIFKVIRVKEGKENEAITEMLHFLYQNTLMSWTKAC